MTAKAGKVRPLLHACAGLSSWLVSCCTACWKLLLPQLTPCRFLTGSDNDSDDDVVMTTNAMPTKKLRAKNMALLEINSQHAKMMGFSWCVFVTVKPRNTS